MNRQQRKDLLLGRPPHKAGISWKNTEAVRCTAAHNRMSHQSCFLLIKKPLLCEVQSVSHVFEDFIEELRTRCLPCTQTPSALLAWEPRSLRNQTLKIRFTTPSAFCGGVDANGDTWVDRRTQTYCTTLMSFLILLSRANQHFCFCTLNVFTLILSPITMSPKLWLIVSSAAEGSSLCGPWHQWSKRACEAAYMHTRSSDSLTLS